MSGATFNESEYAGDITLDHVVPASSPVFAPLPSDLRPELAAALRRRGVERLYSHQAEAYTAVRNGHHLVVVTPTASGKTLCYNLPVLLPHHTRWRRLFASLDFVVIDELHTYRGLFGSQVANVIRRLKRVCAFYGSTPTFICASATIRNPRELAQRLLEEDDLALVDRSGAPRGERRLILYNPPLVSRELGIRRSSMLEARRIAAPWIRDGVQTIVFCRSRLQVEVMLSYLRQDLAPRLDASKRV